MTDTLTKDVKDARAPAEKMALSILNYIGNQDPVESVCALSIATSHCIALVAAEGVLTSAALARVQPDAQVRLIELATELCREARTKLAN